MNRKERRAQRTRGARKRQEHERNQFYNSMARRKAGWTPNHHPNFLTEMYEKGMDAESGPAKLEVNDPGILSKMKRLFGG